jgi:hypothetical protein
MGYIGWINTYEGDPDPKKVHNVESQVVSELLLEGAVPYCKVIFARRSSWSDLLIRTFPVDELATNSDGTSPS